MGTSGFLYDHWRGRFYPPSARGKELEWFAARFDTVELNVTFYRLPSAATFRSWASRVPDDFTFAVKASRYLTHLRRLRDPKEPVDLLMERASELGQHLGPVLLQLPPDLEVDADGLDRTLQAFPSSVRVAVEPRHDSWYTDEVRKILGSHGAALCLADRRGPKMPPWRTAGWAFLRFHGGRAGPASCYGDQALATWTGTVRALWGDRPDGYAYFNNDHAGCALRDAATFARLLRENDVAIGRPPDVPDDVVRRRHTAA
ncbi:MAG TPA: DUF72 domain-containing protein [Actinomycetota bacterium]|nr:DUF72 domain-containing protein [Actinomycetota bacterium]